MKILMTLMGLEIGGAETHVVELSMELKRRGHDVIIVSAGGAYQKDIEAVGIRHYYAPLLSHGGMIKAFFSLLTIYLRISFAFNPGQLQIYRFPIPILVICKPWTM